MAEILLEAIGKRFGAIAALTEVTLEVADGSFVVLLGPTGAGKTTTLRVVAGLERPSAGRVVIGGIDVTGQDPAGRDVAMVFQQFSLYPHYTVFENLAFPLRSPIRRMAAGEIRRRVERVAELLRIAPKLGNRATQLSGGEMQRVAIGRALVREPAAFLMDEPLSSLDAKLREDLRIELKRLQVDRGATVLYVTHDQVEAMTLADRIGVLDKGRLVQVGTPREVYAEPANLHVAHRLGSPPINRLPVGALGVVDGPAGAVTMAVRAEDLELGQGGVEAALVAIEHLGPECIVLAETAGITVHVLAPPDNDLRVGQTTTLRARPAGAHFFDRDERRIAGNPREAGRVA